jgi:hypothetical protein
MASLNLSPPEIASLICSQNHPGRLSADELERLVGHLTNQQMDELVDLLGLGELARQLPPILAKVMKAAQRIVRERGPPEADDEIDAIIRNLDLSSLDGGYSNIFCISFSCQSYQYRALHTPSRFPRAPSNPRQNPHDQIRPIDS